MPASSDNNPGLINSRNPLAYMGVNPYHPPELFIKKFPPTVHDGMNMQRGALWLNVGTSGIPTAKDIWMLVSQALNVNTWVQFGAVGIQTLTASTNATVVPSDNNQNININAGTGITVIGSIPDNSLTINATNAGTVITLTGSDDIAVGPDMAGNINIVGAGASGQPDWITVTGDAATNTLTIHAPLILDTQFDLLETSPTAEGHIGLVSVLGIKVVAIPDENSVAFYNTGIVTVAPSSGDSSVSSSILGVLNLTAGAGMTVTGDNSASRVTFAASGLVATLTGDTGGAITPDGMANINIVGGQNITVDGNNGTHTLTVNTHGAASFFWTSTSSNAIAMAVNHGYITTYAGLATLTLPSVAAVGDIVEVAGFTSNSWKVAQNASQYIRFGNITTTVGTGGSLASSDTGEGVRILCTVANTAFQVLYAVGNLTYV